jgi:hypothetical protein
MSSDPALGKDAVPDSSPFATTFVIQSLALLPSEGLEETLARALDFLVQEQDGEGLWRYWTRRSPRRSLVPPDLDDTSCASWVLSQHGCRFRDNRAAVAANRDAEGRFLTWLGPNEEENDVDGVVNANVVLYLGACPESAAACDYLARLVAAPLFEPGSWYYPDPLALCHAVSRAAWHGVTALRACRGHLLQAVVERCLDGGGGPEPLAAALAATTLLNCEAGGALLESQIEVILASQEADGSWPRAAFYSGPRPPLPRSAWFGSEELTTALCLEAVARYAALDAGGDVQVAEAGGAVLHEEAQ